MSDGGKMFDLKESKLYVTVRLMHIVLIVLFAFGKDFASVVLIPDYGSCLIGKKIDYFEDYTNKVTIDDIIRKQSPVKFTPCTEPIQSYGISTSALWARFNVYNPGRDTQTSYFEVSDAYYNNVEIYKVLNGGISHYQTGIDRPFREREVFDRNFVFTLHIPPGDTLVVYVKLTSRSSKELPFYLYNEKNFRKDKNRESLLLGMFYGILIVFICASLAFFLLLKDINYFIYAFVILSFGLMQGVLDGYTYMYLWPSFPNIQKYSFHCFALFSVLSGLLFGVRFLFPEFTKLPFKRVLFLLLIANVALMIYSFFGSIVIIGNLLDVLVVFSILYTFLIAVISYRNKYHPARYYLMAWSIFLICICIRVLACSGIIPCFPATFYSIQAGILVQIFLTSVAFGDRLRIMQKQNETERMKSSDYKNKTLELQLANLQAQIKPHFLFNTINSIANMVITQPKQAEEALVELSSFYRQTLNQSSRVIVSLREEIEFLNLYLRLEKIKMGKRLTFNIDVASTFDELQLPFMTLQLLVENSIKHGIHPRPSGGCVSVKTETTVDGNALLIVEDNGVGWDTKKIDNGYGLKNIRKGLSYIYGDNCAFVMEDKKTNIPDSESGVRVTINVPFKVDKLP